MLWIECQMATTPSRQDVAISGVARVKADGNPLTPLTARLPVTSSAQQVHSGIWRSFDLEETAGVGTLWEASNSPIATRVASRANQTRPGNRGL